MDLGTGGNNLHRNVIFRDNGDKASQVVPTRLYRPEATIHVICGSGWPAYEDKTGGSVLAIAHNGNLSNGRMFPMIEPGTAIRSTASMPRFAPSGSGSMR